MRTNCPKEHWADTEAAKNPHGYDIAEWSATYDAPHHLYPGGGSGYENLLPGDGLDDKKWPPSSMETK